MSLSILLLTGCSSKPQVEYVPVTRVVTPPADFLETCTIVTNEIDLNTLNRQEFILHLVELYSEQVLETKICNARIEAIRSFIELNKNED